MATDEPGTLLKLSDTDQTVAVGDEDVRGRAVKDRDGEDLGQVDDLLIDEAENKVRFLQVASGGFLGIGENKSFIPIDAITGITADTINIDQTKEHVAGAPVYDPDVVDQRTYYDEVYGYYGFMPFWGTGYMYPSYPYYPIR